MRLPTVIIFTLAFGAASPAFAQATLAERQPNRNPQQWSSDGIARMAPQLSEVLGSIFAGAELCGLTDEAHAVVRKHDEHLNRLAQKVPELDIPMLARSFADTSTSYRAGPPGDCADHQKKEIRQNLPDVFASIDAFHDALALRR